MEHNKRMTSFLTANSIIISSSIFEITHRAFIRTFSQLCVMHTKFDTYYGLCSDRHIAKGNTTTIY